MIIIINIKSTFKIIRNNLKNNKIDINQKLLLDRLRTCKDKVRCYPKLEIFKACHLITLDKNILNCDILELFIRMLPEAIGRQIQIYKPQSNQVSWDEKWIISLIEAISRADYDSVYFLVTSNIKKKYRNEVLKFASNAKFYIA